MRIEDEVLVEMANFDWLKGAKVYTTEERDAIIKKQKMQGEISSSLDNAIENGYDDLLNWTDLEIAEDLGKYDQQCEDFDPQDLVPYIQAWRKARS